MNLLSLDRAIRHRACALKDTTNAIIAAELDPDFGILCEDIARARKNRSKYHILKSYGNTNT